MKRTHSLILCFFLPLLIMSCDLNFINIGESDVTVPEEKDVLTPYDKAYSPDEFFCGATFEVPSDASSIYAELKVAKEYYNLNTITVYGLENLPRTTRSTLYSSLRSLGMKIAVRIESYDSSFAFTESDAEKVAANYGNLVSEVCSAENRDILAYFAVNMPVDDGRVQSNAGGLNTQKWKNAQSVYAKKIISLLREITKKAGYPEAPLYLSVFYGWNNDFQIPSYASAEADGYFMNNYSYPKNYNFDDYSSNAYENLPSADWSWSDLINATRLKTSMDKFKSQYGTSVPLVMEWGIHTAEYNDRKATQQSAGLVKDLDAKRKALSATYDFYTGNYQFVKGFMYFGYNLYKKEGSPSAVMDWCLKYN